MYISRVEIDIENRRKIRDLSHLGAYHHWVEQSFPRENEPNNRTRKLWRIDKLNGKAYLIIVSLESPDLVLLEKYGVTGSAQAKDYNHFLDGLKNGQRMQFRVVLNPVISLSRGSGNRGRIKPHITIEHQRNYLMARAFKNGFSLNEDEFIIVERGYEVFKKHNQQPIRLIKAVYEGILTIEDDALFKKSLTAGFGKHKAYGFGLMTVIPIGK